MDRKLNHTLTALSATGLLLAGFLLVADPVGHTARTAGTPGTAADAVDPPADDAAEPRRREGGAAKGARRGLALPYFSFAHGMRRIGG
ncbi:hypothetical protein WCE41_05930 [Luteimonas sp. MJ246]|uniref:hypothetical protein n=1 Tax=Luteimonas sp. MJ174 TaxID=3129237 RepID=UPI0031BB7DD3